MDYTIKVIPQPEHYFHHVTINDLHVGTGPLNSCNALADELRNSKRKAKLVYDLEKKELAKEEKP